MTLSKGDEPITLKIAHVDLYFFFDIDIAILALEVYVDDIKFETAQNLMFRFGRAYPAYWETKDGRGGHCPGRWSGWRPSGRVLAASDYQNREVPLVRLPATGRPPPPRTGSSCCRRWCCTMADAKGLVRYRQLEYCRMPYMAYLALDRAERCHGRIRSGSRSAARPARIRRCPIRKPICPISRRATAATGISCRAARKASNVRFHASGDTLVVTGDADDTFYTSLESGMLSRFRHQHFLMFLIAHFRRRRC